MHQRLSFLRSVVFWGLAVLFGRLFLLVIPWQPSELWAPLPWRVHLRAQAELEHMKVLRTDDGRGHVLYRNGQPWSGQWNRVVWPVAAAHEVPVAVHSELSVDTPNPVVGQVGRPDVWPDPKRGVAEQGRSGLEYRFDRILSGHRPGYIAALRDNQGWVYAHRLFHLSPIPGLDVRTTIDPAWQSVASSAVTAVQSPHVAVVVLRVADGEALALAGNESTGRYIPAVEGYAPGSVFKLVTAAAALESMQFRPDSRFYCPGYVQAPGVRMACWRVHGETTLESALAESCDTTFATVGMALGRPAFVEIARRLHVLQPQLQSIGDRSVLSEAKPGVVFRRQGEDNGLLANTAIGQEDVRMTPLAAANLVRTIADHGQYRPVRLVLCAQKAGKLVTSFPTVRAKRAVSPFTADFLARAMRLAVTSPTGTAVGLARSPVPVAVKTGTAELPDGRVNGWMVGFAPIDHPQIAFSVFVGDEPSAAAHRHVSEITMKLLGAYRQFHPDSVIG